MAKRVVEEKIQIDQNTSGLTKTNGTAAVLSDIYSYTVPDRSQLIINPNDSIGMYLKDASAECVGTDQVQVVVTDPLGRRTRVIAEGQYTVFKEFQDVTKKKFFGQRVIVPANFIIKVKVKATTVLVNSSCYLALDCTNVYETLD